MSKRPPRLYPDDTLAKWDRPQTTNAERKQTPRVEPIVSTVHPAMSDGEKELQWMLVGMSLASSAYQAKMLDLPTEGWHERTRWWRDAIQQAAGGDESLLNKLLKARGIERRGRVVDDVLRTVHEYLRTHAMESATARMKAAMRLLKPQDLAAWMREEAARVESISGPRIADDTRKESAG